MKKSIEKIVAMLIVFMMLFSDFGIIGKYGISYATEAINNTDNKNILLDSYFKDKAHEASFDLSKEDSKLFVDVKLKGEGYLKNAKISFEDENFEIVSEKMENSMIEKFENNIIYLKQLKTEESANNEATNSVILEIPIKIKNAEKINIDLFSKEFNTTLLATYVDENGKEKKITGTVKNKLNWTAKPDTEMSVTIEKYVPFHSGEKYGVLVQIKANTKIKDNILPIKSTNLKIETPLVNNKFPTEAKVVANRTKATNGEENGLKFNQEDNYKYDAESGLLEINVENKADEKNEVSWIKNTDDEYLISFIYDGKEIYDYINENKFIGKVKAMANVIAYSAEDINVKENIIEGNIDLDKKLSDIVSFKVETKQKEISKGQIYANYDTKEKKELEYNLKYTADVAYTDIIDYIEFSQDDIDRYVTGDNQIAYTTIENKNYVKNKEIKVDVKVFNKILGEDGYIEILDEKNKGIGKINKELEAKDGNYIVDLSKLDNNKLIIKTSKPVEEGKLYIDVTKVINGNQAFSKVQMEEFKNLKISLNGITNNESIKEEADIKLTEPTSIVGLEVNKTDLTTVVKNEDVQIRAILDTSSYNNALYKEPVLKIKLPTYISKANLKKCDILMANGLSFKNTPKLTEEKGQKIVTIELKGIQSEYTIDADYKGTIVILYADLETDVLTPSTTEKIEIEFTNNNEVSINKNGKVEIPINFVAPVGVVAANGIKGEKDNVMTIAEEGATVELDANSKKETETIYGTVINNYPNTIKDVVILGRVPAKGNTNIDNGKSLESTFNTTLNKVVTVEGLDKKDYKIYYSNNEKANTSLEDKNNNWTETATTGSKSYMIVAKSAELKTGDTVKFSYDVEVPEKIAHNNTAYEMYKVYYTNNSDIGTIQESQTSSIIAMSTGEGVELTATLKTDAEVIRRGQIVKMTAEVKNTGSITANNVKVTLEKPDYASFVKYTPANGFESISKNNYVLTFDNIEINKTKEVSYYVKINENIEVNNDVIEVDSDSENENIEANTQQLSLYPLTITNKAEITANNLEGRINTEYLFNVMDGNIFLKLINKNHTEDILKVDDEITYNLYISNISEDTYLENTVVDIHLTEGNRYESAFIKELANQSDEEAETNGITYDENNNIVTIELGDIKSYKIIKLKTSITRAKDSIQIYATARADNAEICYSNVLENKSERIDLEVSDLTATPKYIKDTSTITYSLQITNKSAVTANNINVLDTLPTELELVEASYTYLGQKILKTNYESNIVDFKILRIEPGETVTVKLTARAMMLSNKNDKEIRNKMLISADGMSDITTNTVTNIIEYDEEVHRLNNESGDTNVTPTPTIKTYKITGTAWLDDNKNGKRDDEEATLPNVTAVLLDKDTNNIVKDRESNKEKKTLTDNNGKYEFNNLLAGEYIVVFLYDAANYDLTTYQAKDVDSSLNSDVISINIVVDGNRTIAATTDSIKITNSNARDIDIGLFTAKKFDFKLDKYISKITLTTPTIGTKVYEYNNSKLAKIEILGQNAGKANAVIEYKIVVTNEGAVPGYVKKIVDYIPKSLGFNTELNKDWYLSDNGNIYNASLANTIINPGESKEVTLLVTKKITEDSLGSILNNNAEIYEIYNELGLQDMDSNAANKVQEEDDMSEANVVLSLVTGTIIKYTTIALGVATIIALGIYGIRRKILTKK